MRLLSVVMLLAASGCAHRAELFLAKEVPIYDKSAVRSSTGEKRFSKVIVLPPSGNASSEYESQVANFEREFLRNGVTVISGAVTGRVVLDFERNNRKTETAAPLTDIERALVMAQNTGAEAILQIGAFRSAKDVRSRFLVYDPAKGIEEVSLRNYEAWTGPKTALTSRATLFVGKLIDVSTGEVVASFEIGCASLWNLPADFRGPAAVGRRGWRFGRGGFSLLGRYVPGPGRQFVYEEPEWEPQARKQCVDRILERLISLSLSRDVPPRSESPVPALDI